MTLSIFVDTSAIYALMVADDAMHVRAKCNFSHFDATQAQLITSSYVILESIALLQNRHGIEAVWDFNSNLVPLFTILWVDRQWHQLALDRLQTINRQKVSLTDCLSFEIMEMQNIEIAFSFDKHFETFGFQLAAYHDPDQKID